MKFNRVAKLNDEAFGFLNGVIEDEESNWQFSQGGKGNCLEFLFRSFVLNVTDAGQAFTIHLSLNLFYLISALFFRTMQTKQTVWPILTIRLQVRYGDSSQQIGVVLSHSKT